MNKLFKPASILMYLLVIIIFFMAGMTLAGVSGVADGQGLAGGAIVFFYGVISAIIAFMFSLFVVYKTKIITVIKINKILGVVFLLAVCIFIYRIILINKDETPEKELPTKVTAPAASNETSMVSFKPVFTKQNVESKMSIGFFSPNYFEYPTLYFYGAVNLEKSIIEHMPMDSVVFTKDKHLNPTTSYAPPWLYPEHLKLDYGVITFKVLGIGHDFIKVEANKQTKQITYLDKEKGTFMSWSEFLLSNNSVEFKHNSLKKVFVKPLDYAGEIKVDFSFMKPLLIEEDWMFVKLVDANLREQGKGWVRWKNNEKLLIKYSLFS